jgi:phage terminase large subunit-like protein
VTASPGDVIDYDQIEEELLALHGELDLRRLHFDRWGSKQIVNHLQGEQVPVFEMGQGFASFSPAMKETERLIYERRLRHGGNLLLRHAVQSLAVVQDAAGNVKPDRDRSTGFIDPWVALVMAVDAWTRDAGGVSIYEERGLEVV